jgi:ribosomal protein L18E
VTINNAASYAKLFDASEMDPQLSDDDVMVVGARVSAYAAYDPRGAVAAVATTTEARDAVRRYMNFAGAKRSIQLFTSLDDARAWLLGQSPA